jgi:hypothetical protein
MTQEQVLEHEVAVRPHQGQHGFAQQPEEFEHASKITHLRFAAPHLLGPTTAVPREVLV